MQPTLCNRNKLFFRLFFSFILNNNFFFWILTNARVIKINDLDHNELVVMVMTGILK